MAKVRKLTQELIDKFNKKKYSYNIDAIEEKLATDKTIRPIEFGWNLSSGYKTVLAYGENEDFNHIVAGNPSIAPYHSYFFEYDKEKNGILMIPIVTSGDMSKRSTCENTKWEIDKYRSPLFVSPEKDILTCHSMYNWETRGYEDYHWSQANQNWYTKTVVAQDKKYVYNIFKKVFGNILVIRNTAVALTEKDFENPYRIELFIKIRERKASQKTLNENKKIFDSVNSKSDDLNGVKDGFMLDYNNGVIYLRMISNGVEYGRFIPNTKTGEFIYLVKNNSGWVKKKTPDISHMNINKFVINERCNNSDFKYKQEIVKEYRKYLKNYYGNRPWGGVENKVFSFTLKIIKNNLLESVCKVANESLKNFIFNNGGELKQVFGCINNINNSTLYSKLGMNPYQFKNTKTGEEIRFAKKLYDTTDISFLDNETWDKIIEIGEERYNYIKLGNIKREKGYRLHYCNVSECRYPDMFSNDWNLIDDLEVLGIKRDVRVYQKTLKYYMDGNVYIIPKEGYGGHTYTTNVNLYSAYMDYIKMVKTIRVAEEPGWEEIVKSFDLFPKTEDVMTLHDRAIEFANKVKDAAKQKDWDSAIKRTLKREKVGETFSIVVPKNPGDLKTEGQIQGICIGGYVDSVLSKRCEIVFLRKNNAIKTPYFAMEIQGNIIHQCHGKSNRWLGNISDDKEFNEAYTFLAEWLTENKLSCSDRILRNTSGTYGGYNGDFRKISVTEEAEKIIETARKKGSLT